MIILLRWRRFVGGLWDCDEGSRLLCWEWESGMVGGSEAASLVVGEDGGVGVLVWHSFWSGVDGRRRDETRRDETRALLGAEEGEEEEEEGIFKGGEGG